MRDPEAQGNRGGMGPWPSTHRDEVRLYVERAVRGPGPPELAAVVKVVPCAVERGRVRVTWDTEGGERERMARALPPAPHLKIGTSAA